MLHLFLSKLLDNNIINLLLRYINGEGFEGYETGVNRKMCHPQFCIS